MPATFFPSETEFYKKVKFLTNGTLDDILDDHGLLSSLGLAQSKNGYPLTETEMEFVQEDSFQLYGVTAPHDLLSGQTALYEGKKFHAPVIEFHFRNDATRYMWGSPVTLEKTLPRRKVVKPVAERCFEIAQEKLAEIGGIAHLCKTGYIETNDRYALWMLIPFSWIIANCETGNQYRAWLKDLFV